MKKDTAPIRRLDTRKDLLQAADLIEISFGPYLDPDGHIYLRQIRRAASNHRLVKWSFAAGEWISYPLNGFVWEEDNRLVGNLSLIPFYWKRRWIVLIANVAVHPDYRRQGIARKLTKHALDHLRQLSIRSIWLHVRQENLIARRLYESFNFIERYRRDTWVTKDPYTPETAGSYAVIKNKRLNRDWPFQEKILKELYPEEIRWHMSLNFSMLRPGIFSTLQRHLNGHQVAHFSAFIDQKLAAIATWESSFTYADPVSLAINPGDEKVLPTLLSEIKQKHSFTRPLLVNIPTGYLGNTLPQAGFERINTLVWMSLDPSTS